LVYGSGQKPKKRKKGVLLGQDKRRESFRKEKSIEQALTTSRLLVLTHGLEGRNMGVYLLAGVKGGRKTRVPAEKYRRLTGCQFGFCCGGVAEMRPMNTI